MVIHLVVSTWEQGWRSWRRNGGKNMDQTLLSVGLDPGEVSPIQTPSQAEGMR